MSSQAHVESEKRIKAVKKKLGQIEKLKEKDPEELDAEATAKMASEKELKAELQALERGEAVARVEVPQAPVEKWLEPPPKVPLVGEEKEKRVKGLQKKLDQIQGLKEKEPSTLDADAKGKIANEGALRKELRELDGPSVEEAKEEQDAVQSDLEAEKHEIEKKIRALNKKLESVAKLKKLDSLTAEEQAKVDQEATLAKEKTALEHRVGEINKVERARVVERMGWEDEVKVLKIEEKEADRRKARNKV